MQLTVKLEILSLFNRVEILDEIVYISLCADVIKKGKNLFP